MTRTRDRAIDLSGDIAAARREAREQWLTRRDPQAGSAATAARERQGWEQTSPKLILPDDDLSK